MTRLLIVLFLLGLSTSNAQIYEPVTWSTNVIALSENEYELQATASIEKGWHLYSQNVPKNGPIPTLFVFKSSTDYELLGAVEEEEGHVVDDPVFRLRITYFEEEATFKQRIRVNKSLDEFTASVEFMVCDDERCLPPNEIDLVFRLNSSGNESITKQNIPGVAASNGNSSLEEQLYGMRSEEMKTASSNCGNQNNVNPQKNKGANNSLWHIFGLGFLGGLLALLTPCVFPMIPLTVSFFTKSSENNKGKGIQNALIYGFFILSVYLLLSVPFHLLDSVNPDILNEISTNIWLNVIFFVVFVLFAFSFFGYYELTLPSRWTNHTTKGESARGLIGIFFMALTLALVSFSCTGPILGSLLAGSLTSDGGAWQLSTGMAGFGFALGMPFALFAMFPKLMDSLPKSGGWLNTTKVILGFLELALAIKFLSNADLVAHWGLLKIEPFLILWIILFTGLALYLLGKLKFPHDAPHLKLSFPRWAGAFLVFAFVVYLASGFRVNKNTQTFTSLTLLSGLAPPAGYSYLYPNECPNNLNCFKDLQEGIDHAKKVNKPILLDFTGYACVNCRKMEEHVWPKPKIKEFLEKDYVLISLYVDDKKTLPAEEQIQVERSNGGSRKLKNYGHKWAHFQTQFFKTNAQPYYVLLSPDGKTILNEAVGYTPDEDTYAAFLACGLLTMKR